MSRDSAAILLTEYTQFLLKEGYTYVDVLGQDNEPSAIDRFMGTQWFRFRYPLVQRESVFYKNCKRQRKNGAKICQDCPFRKHIESQE